MQTRLCTRQQGRASVQPGAACGAAYTTQLTLLIASAIAPALCSLPSRRVRADQLSPRPPAPLATHTPSLRAYLPALRAAAPRASASPPCPAAGRASAAVRLLIRSLLADARDPVAGVSGWPATGRCIPSLLAGMIRLPCPIPDAPKPREEGPSFVIFLRCWPRSALLEATGSRSPAARDTDGRPMAMSATARYRMRTEGEIKFATLSNTTHSLVLSRFLFLDPIHACSTLLFNIKKVAHISRGS